MKKPKVSLVIPAHNEEFVISETLRAVLAQDYPDFEVIVVNNASKDKTAEVAGQFPVKVVHEERKGLLFARERGRVEATGEIIVNIDADCLPEKDWLSRGISHFTHDGIIAVSGPYDYYDGGFIFRNISLMTQRYVYRFMSILLQHPKVRQGAIIIGGNNFIRSDALKKSGGYNTALTFYGEDTDTAKRIAEHGRVVFNPTVVMKTSARRFKDEGTVKITVKYLFHFFKVVFSKRSN